MFPLIQSHQALEVRQRRSGNTPANTRAYQRNYTYDHLVRHRWMKLEHNAGVSASFNRYINDYDTAAAYQTANTASKIKAGINTTNYTFDDCGNPPVAGL